MHALFVQDLNEIVVQILFV